MTRRDRSPAIRALEAAGVDHEPRQYVYVDHGGTAHAAACLGVDEHAVVKTLVFEAGDVGPVIVLMHGDRQVSTRTLARLLEVRRAAPCSPEAALRHTGYRVGGISPFGIRRPLPVLIERTILDLDRMWLNAGRRGLLVGVDPREVAKALDARPVEVAEPPKR